MRTIVLTNALPTMAAAHIEPGLFICEIWLVKMCDTTRYYVGHDSVICVTWLIHMCDMSHSYVWRALFVCVLHIYVCFIYVWEHVLVVNADLTAAQVGHDSFICVTWFIHMYDMFHSYMWCALFVCVLHIYVCFIYGWEHVLVVNAVADSDRRAGRTWLIHMCDMTYSYVWHVSFIYVMCLICLCFTYLCVF